MPEQNPASRRATICRKTSETNISATVLLDGTGTSNIHTGVVFLDHMLTSFSKHSGIDINLVCDGDLAVDDHHSVEDSAMVLGSALAEALGEKRGIKRYGWALIPMDEVLARCAIDLGGRSYAVVRAVFDRPVIQGFSTEMVEHFFVSLAGTLKANIHLAVLEGNNTHHKIEGLFKSFAYAMREAIMVSGSGIPSTKGQF